MVCFGALGLSAPVADGFVFEDDASVACEFGCVAFGHCVSFVVVMLLAPLATPAVALLRVSVSGVCAPHISQLFAVGCRTV